MGLLKEQMQIFPVGDSALGIRFGETIDPQINERVHTFAAALLDRAIPGVVEVVPGYTTLLVHYDPLNLTYAEVKNRVELCVINTDRPNLKETKLIEIPTIYGDEFGPDLMQVAAFTRLTTQEVIKLHSSVIYPVYMMGFTPGFPYLGGMDSRLATPRLSTPRKLVRAGSVGIAGAQTGIYSVDSPGGWQLIGFTPLVLFDPQREPPFLIRPGDSLKFVPVSREEAGL